MKNSRLAQIAATLVLVLAACAPARPQASAPGDNGPRLAAKQRVVTTILADPPGMFKELTNPGGNGSVPGLAELTNMVHGGASYSDDVDVWQPLLAEAVP